MIREWEPDEIGEVERLKMLRNEAERERLKTWEQLQEVLVENRRLKANLWTFLGELAEFKNTAWISHVIETKLRDNA